MSDPEVKRRIKIVVGDNVEWTKVTSRGKSINMTQQYGQVISIEEGLARVQVKGKKITMKKVDALRITGTGHNQLTDLMYAMSGR